MIESTESFTDWVAADGVNKDWSYDFTILAAGDAYIQYKNGADGVVSETQVDVSFFPDADYAGGYLKYPVAGTALANTYFVRVVRRLALTQSTDFTSQGTFNPTIHQRAFDRHTMVDQQIQAELDRVPKLPMGETGGVITALVEGELVRATAGNGLEPAGVTAENIEDWSNAAEAAAAAAEADAATVAADKAIVAADKATVAADKAIVAADKATVAADKGIVAADKLIVEGYRDEVEADRVATAASETAAGASAASASASAATAVAAKDEVLTYGDWNSRYLGDQAADPTTWNQSSPLDPGTDPLIPGLVYYNTVVGEYRTYSGSEWASGSGDTSDFARLSLNGSDYTAATFRTNLSLYSKAEIDAMPGSVASKTTPIDADSWSIWDSVASAWKRVTGANLKAYLKTYFDTLYQAAGSVATHAALTVTHGATGAIVGTTNTQTLSGKTLTNPAIEGVVVEDVFTITDAAAYVINPSDGGIQRWTLGANRTAGAKHADWANGKSVTLYVADGSAFTLDLTTTMGVVWKDGIAPTLPTSGYAEINIAQENNILRGVHIGNFAS